MLTINHMFRCHNQKRTSLPHARLLIGLSEKAKIKMRAGDLTLSPKVLDNNIVFSKIVFTESKRKKTTLPTTSQEVHGDDDEFAYIDEIVGRRIN